MKLSGSIESIGGGGPLNTEINYKIMMLETNKKKKLLLLNNCFHTNKFI